jgi:hypothetical protein
VRSVRGANPIFLELGHEVYVAADCGRIAHKLAPAGRNNLFRRGGPGDDRGPPVDVTVPY